MSDGSHPSIRWVDRTSRTILGGVIDAETPFKDALLKQISPKDLIFMSAISGDMQTMVDRHLRQSLEDLLAQFVTYPSDLRDLMRSTRSVISGSVALWFICGGPASWFPSDCDVYTPIGQASSVVTFLKTRMGYTVDEDPTADGYRRLEGHGPSDASYPERQGEIFVIRSLTRLVNENMGRYINIFESSTLSALQPIPRFWSTLQANYISADSLCVAYPFLTMNGKGCITPTGLTPVGNLLVVIEKYRKRGFAVADFSFNVDDQLLAIFPGIIPQCESNPYCPHALRFFGDKWCLQYAFDEQNSSNNPVDEITVRWRYGGDICGVCDKQTAAEIQAVTDAGER